MARQLDADDILQQTKLILWKHFADFESGTNGMATLIICRKTDETARSGLVHAFAPKESGSNTPPLLRVKPRGD